MVNTGANARIALARWKSCPQGKDGGGADQGRLRPIQAVPRLSSIKIGSYWRKLRFGLVVRALFVYNPYNKGA